MWDKLVSILGGNLFSGVADVIGKFVEDPTKALEARAAIARLELEYRTKVLEADVRDVDSARRREMEVKDSTPRNLAYLYTLGYFAALFVCWEWGIPDKGHDVFVTLLGVLTAAQAAIMGYYFGSSHGSDRKTDSLAHILKNGNGGTK